MITWLSTEFVKFAIGQSYYSALRQLYGCAPSYILRLAPCDYANINILQLTTYNCAGGGGPGARAIPAAGRRALARRPQRGVSRGGRPRCWRGAAHVTQAQLDADLRPAPPPHPPPRRRSRRRPPPSPRPRLRRSSTARRSRLRWMSGTWAPFRVSWGRGSRSRRTQPRRCACDAWRLRRRRSHGASRRGGGASGGGAEGAGRALAGGPQADARRASARADPSTATPARRTAPARRAAR